MEEEEREGKRKLVPVFDGAISKRCSRGSPLIWRSTPRISVRSLDCHSLTMSLGSFFLNKSMKPIVPKHSCARSSNHARSLTSCCLAGGHKEG